jgi:hypothetical protein
MERVIVDEPHNLGAGVMVVVERVDGEVTIDLRETAQVHGAKDVFLTQVGVKLTRDEWRVLDASELLVKHQLALYYRFKDGDLEEPQTWPINLSVDAFVSIDYEGGANVRILKTPSDDSVETISFWPNTWRTLTRYFPEISRIANELAVKTT